MTKSAKSAEKTSGSLVSVAVAVVMVLTGSPSWRVMSALSLSAELATNTSAKKEVNAVPSAKLDIGALKV